MPVLQDRRRILGPTDRQKLQYVEKLEYRQDITEEESSKISKPTPNNDSRGPKECRPIFIRTGVVANSNGSVYYEVGPIKLQCAVYGPKPIRGSFTTHASLNVEVRLSSFYSEEIGIEDTNEEATGGVRSSGSSSLERNLALFVQSAIEPSIILDQYPKSAIEIVVSVISASDIAENLAAASTNAASIALADAGILLSDLVTAGSAMLSKLPDTESAVTDGSTIYMDPDNIPSSSSSIMAVVAFMTARNDEIVGMWMQGGQGIDEHELPLILDSTKSMAHKVRVLINGVLTSEFKEKEAQLKTSVTSL